LAKKVDTTALKVNQTGIIAFTLLAYILDQPWLVVFVGLVLAIGTIWPRAALFKETYRRGFRPLGWPRPNFVDDDPAPHRFAQGLGAVFLGLSSLALIPFTAPLLGWVLAGLVVVLAAANLFLDFCAGCFVYYQLARLGLIKRTASYSKG
jgi:hypothetical protein